MDRPTPLPPGLSGPPVFRDGFGARFLGFEPDSGDPIEVLAFDEALTGSADFAEAVGLQVARLSGARHTSFARARRIERPAPDSFLLVEDRVSGWRLAEVLDIAQRAGLSIDTSAILNLLRQLVPAVALFGRQQRSMRIGNIAPERLILTPQGRLVLAEYVLGEAIDTLKLSRDELWQTFRIPSTSADGGRDQRSDVLAIGVVALSLLLGRRLREDEFPFAIGDLLQLATETHGGDSRPLSPRLATLLGRMLQLEGHKPLKSPKDAQVAFEELLATERDYVTSPAQLEAFVARFEQRAGPPLEPTRPVAVAPEPLPPSIEPPQPSESQPDAGAVEELAAADAIARQPQVEDTAPSYIAAPPQPVAEIVEPPVTVVERVPAAEEPPAAGAIEPVEPERATASPLFPSIDAVAERDLAPAALTSEAPLASATVSEASPAIESPALFGATTGAASTSPSSWMGKALAGLALLAIVEAGVIAWLWNRSAEALMRDGELTVQSRPPAARVTVDDDEVGATPVTVRLSPGTYTVKVQAATGEPRVIVVQIRPGVQTAQYLELQSGR